eukprot:15471587-Alexandrium_andersonii.AAC.1
MEAEAEAEAEKEVAIVVEFGEEVLPLDESQDRFRHSRATATTLCLGHAGGPDFFLWSGRSAGA